MRCPVCEMIMVPRSDGQPLYPLVCPAEKDHRIAALEAENAKLEHQNHNFRASLQPFPPELDWQELPFFFYGSPGAHDPCYIGMPGCSGGIPLNHHATEGVDIARAKWIIDACNARLPWVIASWKQEEEDWKSQLTAALDKNAMLREALERYGKHDWADGFSPLTTCPFDPEQGFPCTCGLNDALTSTAQAAQQWRERVEREAFESFILRLADELPRVSYESANGGMRTGAFKSYHIKAIQEHLRAAILGIQFNDVHK